MSASESERSALVAATARVETDRASRHLIEVCKHASKMETHLHQMRSHGAPRHAPPEIQHVEWSDVEGLIRLRWGRCILRATADALILRVETPDQESLRQLEDFISHRLESIGSRDHLVVRWQSSEEPRDRVWSDDLTSTPTQGQ